MPFPRPGQSDGFPRKRSSGAPAGTPVQPPPNPPSGQAPDPFAGAASAPPIPFPNSYWARALPANIPAWWSKGQLKAANSSALVTNYIANCNSPYPGAYMNPVSSRYVLNTQGSSSATQVTLTTNPNGRWPPSGPPSPEGTLQLPVFGPPWLVGDNSDHQVVIWDWFSKITYSLWGNDTSSGNVALNPPQCNTGQFILSTDGNYPGFGPGNLSALSSSTAACGAPYISTLISYADFLWGSINHMLFFSIGSPTGNPVDPAPFSDGVNANTIASGLGVPEGSIMTFPSSVTMTQAAFASAGSTDPAFAMMVFTAIKTYGALCGDSNAGNGVGYASEDFDVWNNWNPQKFPSQQQPYWMWTDQAPHYGQGPLMGMPWSQAIFLEPGSLLPPGVSDNNGSLTSAMQDAQGAQVTSSTGSIVLNSSTSLDDMVIVFGMLGPTGATGNTISGLGGTWVNAFPQFTVTYLSDNSVRVVFCLIGYGCTAGNNTLTTSFTAAGDLCISRWSRSVATNPLVSAVTNSSGATGVQANFPSSSINVTAATGQMVLGMLGIGWSELTESSLPALTELNYGGTSWSNGKLNRHIINGQNEKCSVFQDFIVPTATGAVTATFQANGFKGWGGWGNALVLLQP